MNIFYPVVENSELSELLLVEVDDSSLLEVVVIELDLAVPASCDEAVAVLFLVGDLAESWGEGRERVW